MKKLLIISYYWPPAGGVAVQRWLKMTKYFPDAGYQPIIYTAEPDTYVAHDDSLLDQVHPSCEVIKQKIWEPYKIYAAFTGNKKKNAKFDGMMNADKRNSFTQKISVFIRSNFFIPDARAFWVKPSIKYLTEWLEKNPVDVIISTGPPHSMHLIALGVKKHYPKLPWVADFRDPWTKMDIYQDLSLSAAADRKHHRLEKEVLQQADRIVTVSWMWQNQFSTLSSRNDVECILNGYDEDDFSSFKTEATEEFIICHIGSMNKDRNPEYLWKSIFNIVNQNSKIAKRLKIHLIGAVDYSITVMIDKYDLNSYVVISDFIPHDQVIRFLRKSSLLLLLINQAENNLGRLPSKAYEYIATRKPILALGPKQGDIANILNPITNAGLFEYDDEAGIQRFIEQTIENPSLSDSDISKYSRKSLAAQYIALLNQIT